MSITRREFMKSGLGLVSAAAAATTPFMPFIARAGMSSTISSVTVAEMMYGVAKSQYKDKNKSALESFLAPLEIVDFDFKAAQHYGTVRAYLEKMGTPIGAYDLMIAAHALSLGLVLITNNEREFQRIPDLIVENWVNQQMKQW